MIKKWKEISRETVFDNWRKIEKVVFEMPNGKTGSYYLNSEGDASAVLALTKDKKIILIKQFRPGPGKILTEIPGGAIKKGSNPLKTAKEELLEETGYSGKFRLVASDYHCGFSTVIRNYFVAIDCEKVSEQKLDETEFIEVELMPIKKFRNFLKNGKIKMTDTAGAYLCLDYLRLL